MGRETMIEYEVQEPVEQKRDVWLCDECGGTIGPVEEFDPIRIIVNPEVYRSPGYSAIEADISRELCPSCAVEEFGVTVEAYHYDVRLRKNLREENDELKAELRAVKRSHPMIGDAIKHGIYMILLTGVSVVAWYTAVEVSGWFLTIFVTIFAIVSTLYGLGQFLDMIESLTDWSEIGK